MRAVINFENRGVVKLPLQYNYLVESAIYSSLSAELSSFLHEYGFSEGNRRFKLFTFSRLMGRYRIEGSSISFTGRISLAVSSPIKRFVEELVNGVAKAGRLRIGRSILKVASVYFPESPRIGETVYARTLSPITVYSTLYTADRKRKTYYYSPYEREFSELITSNAMKKLRLISRRTVKRGLSLSPVRMKEVIVSYKGTVVKAWSGSFILSGPVSLIRTVYDAGLGSKNSQGFGMFEIVEGKRW
ncbi:MAG: CRISPR-associated endoribonuclease Cas6 [Nitrososphaeria archaeon]